MIKISRAVIVEGKYDKIRLENILDAVIITTDGFRIFKDIEKRELIRKIAAKKGLLIITDSDKAGSVIRGHIKSFVTEGDIANVYLPQILGKEKRKSHASAEGYLGVEGTPDDIIKKALERFADKEDVCSKKIDKNDMFTLGLSGATDSLKKRKDLQKFLGLPENLTTPALLDALNSLYTYNEFMEEIGKWQQGLVKS